MPVDWLEALTKQVDAGEIDPFNTKEDFEVLAGLYIGNEFWEKLTDLFIVANVRLYDTLL